VKRLQFCVFGVGGYAHIPNNDAVLICSSGTAPTVRRGNGKELRGIEQTIAVSMASKSKI
jgi:hypothetical protein